MVRHGRRHFLTPSATGIGALTSLLATEGALPAAPKITSTAKRIIYLFQLSDPSQFDLFSFKPVLKDRFATELTETIRKGERLSGMTATQASFPIAPSKYRFQRHGKSDA